jgi:gluconate 5-dehydrogenase
MTEANRKWQQTDPALIDAIIANIPMGRSGEPDELGPLAVYLASPAAAYVTGAAFIIDGGYTLW